MFYSAFLRALRFWPLLVVVALAVALLWLKPARELSAALVMATYLGGCLLVWQRQRRPSGALDVDGQLLVAYASQGDQARQYAERSVEQLQQAGLPAQLCALSELTPSALAEVPRVLFVVSTYGEGEAPDNGAHFARQIQTTDIRLDHLEYAVLALGDRRYRHFCGFGNRLDARLRALHATPLFDRVDVDRGEAGALRHWQQHLALLTGHQPFSDWLEPSYQSWTLLERRCLNPGSAGRPISHLSLAPPDTAVHWQAGDIAEIGPRQPRERIEALLDSLGLDGDSITEDGTALRDALALRQLPEQPHEVQGLTAQALLDSLPALAHRAYSIASSPTQGRLELLVRQMYQPDGSPGVGSNWLCREAPMAGEIDLRIRANPGFHGPAAQTPMILIGSGTGLAGLLAHLREREHTPGTRNWLLFGERNAASDALFSDELGRWRETGHLARLDLAFSRDQQEKRYVQHLLRDAADDLRDWVEDGATIYLCGSLDGMGREVHSMLLGLLGEQTLDALSEQGRYRRDLY